MHMKQNKGIWILCLLALTFISCTVAMQENTGYDSKFINYASAANGATVEVSHENRAHPSQTLINGIKDSEKWGAGEGWETHFSDWLRRRIAGGYRSSPGLRGTAMGWVVIRFSEPKRIHRVVVYTVDSAKMPARTHGIRDLWLQYVLETGEWMTVERTDKTKKHNKNIIYENRLGRIVFNFKPVTTDKIRLAILSTSDMKRLSGYSSSYYRTQQVEGTIRLLEIEAYGLGRATTTMVDTQEQPGF
ncbi:hypothetical protein IH992_14620 [Candidatus Poribacteria bacterium]|nr:hypothetical protein [Candidatus Poribacteria bacterium]